MRPWGNRLSLDLGRHELNAAKCTHLPELASHFQQNGQQFDAMSDGIRVDDMLAAFEEPWYSARPVALTRWWDL